MFSSLKNYSLCTMLFLTLTAATTGQGLLVNESSVAVSLPRSSVIVIPHPIPRPPVTPVSTYAVKSLDVNATINGQIAEVNVSQTFVNTGSVQMEVSFVFPLPYDGAIDAMTLLVDGKEFAAKLLNAKDARKTYEDIVRRNRDPALLEWVGNGMFKTSVFPVPVGASRTVTLRYSQLLKVDGGMTDFLFPMSTAKYTAKPLEKIEIHLNVETPDDIKNVYSPTHEINIKRPTAKRATISYEAANIVPSNDFRLLFDSGKGEVSARILSYRPDVKEDGYFMLLASPKVDASGEKPSPKNVIIALDQSGSMSGKKIVQARDAVKFVLQNLNDGDSFNIIPYSSGVTKFKEEIQPVNKEMIAEAMAFTDSIRATGSTNIDAALRTSLVMNQDAKTPAYILFLTDGCPTVGEMDEMKLNEIATASNLYDARLFVFGVGYDVNSRLLDRLSKGNRGQSEYVKPDEEIEERVARLYNKISSPVLTDVTFTVNRKEPADKAEYITNQVYPAGTFDLFAGEQLVLVGRYAKSGAVDMKVKGKHLGNEKTFDFGGTLVDKSNDAAMSFIARLWAMRRIGEILSQIDLKGENKELIDELVSLSTTYGILTPYTSFLADETTNLTSRNENALESRKRLSQLSSNTTGESGVAQRAYSNAIQSANSLDESKKIVMKRHASGMVVPSTSSMSDGSAPDQRGAIMSSMSADVTTAETSQMSNVQSINNRTFFQKGGVWIDSTLNETQQKPENIITVKQFTPEYFQLIEKHGQELAPYISLGGTQLVNVGGQAYRFEL